MEIINKKLDDLKPYENNPRFNDDAVQFVAESIKQFGFKVPIVIDKNNVIVAGHTRYKASMELGLNEVPCIIADDLTDEQIKAFRLADNKVSERATWNNDLLELELDDIKDLDMKDFGFIDLDLDSIDTDGSSALTNEKYTTKIDIPQYEIKGEQPEISELYDDTKTKKLIEKIEASNITDEQKDFLIKAAQRHNIFNYSKIAEYYAHTDKEMQELMEESALVIIDFDDAIKNGYVELKSEILDLEDDEYE